jgi:diacylglycerol kinase
MVFITEMLNTAIEFLCDHVSPEIHPAIKKVKDLAAAAVLFAAIAAVCIGCVVFWKYI